MDTFKVSATTTVTFKFHWNKRSYQLRFWWAGGFFPVSIPSTNRKRPDVHCVSSSLPLLEKCQSWGFSSDFAHFFAILGLGGGGQNGQESMGIWTFFSTKSIVCANVLCFGQSSVQVPLRSLCSISSLEGPRRKPRHASVSSMHSDTQTQAVPAAHCIRMSRDLFFPTTRCLPLHERSPKTTSTL